jgi:hypothetical protein
MTDDDLAAARRYADASTDTTADPLRGCEPRRAGAARAAVASDRIASASPMVVTATSREYLRDHYQSVTVRDVAGSSQRR